MFTLDLRNDSTYMGGLLYTISQVNVNLTFKIHE